MKESAVQMRHKLDWNGFRLYSTDTKRTRRFEDRKVLKLYELKGKRECTNATVM